MDGPSVAVVLFSWVDYLMFGVMLSLSALVGIYFGFYEKQQDNTTEYLLGGKTMHFVPIAMSLVASHMSGITMLGIPAEIYQYGMYYSGCFITTAVCATAVAFVYMPVFYKLQLPCSFDYLRLRFDKRCQLLASFLFALDMLLYIPLVIYVPALAFSQVTGLSIHVITPITCIVCIFYTTVGGLKAVVWTDALQLSIMIGAMFTVLVMGIQAGGGWANIWEIAEKGERLQFFDPDPSPTLRTSMWGIIIGMSFGYVSYIGISQTSVQRFLAVPTIQDARRSVWYLCGGHLTIKLITCVFGLLLYAQYSTCDPLRSGKISRADQILPLYVMDIAGKVPGLPGLFTAGVFCAALSTMSSGLNSLAGTIYEDYMAPFMPANTTEKRASNIMKLLVVVLGVLTTSMVFLVPKMGGVLQLSVTLGGITAGPTLGLYTLGMLFPSANEMGALVGAVTSLIFMGVMVLGAQYHFSQGYSHPTKPISIDGCNATNITSQLLEFVTPSEQVPDLPPFFFRISFYYYTLIGCFVLLVVGLTVSWITGQKEEVNRDYLSPVVHWMLPKKKENYEYIDVKDAVPRELEP